MEELRIFKNELFGEIRTILINGEPYFVGKDVAIALGYTNTNDAISQHVDNEDKIMGSKNATPSITDTLGRNQYPTWINESGIYSLVFGSQLSDAKKFKHWVTHDVLPTLRKNGSYSLINKVPKTFADALRLAADQQEEIDQQKLLLEQQAPKVAFANAIEASKSSCLIGELAKIITQNGYTIGQNRLFEWLRNNGYLGTKGEYYNIPNQTYIEQGLFDLKKGVRSGNDGVMHTTITTKVTGKGCRYFINKFLRNK